MKHQSTPHPIPNKPEATDKALATIMRRSNPFFAASVAILTISITLLAVALAVQRNSLHAAKPGNGYSMQRNVTSGAVTMSVTSISFSDGSGHFAAPRGMHYAIIDFAIRNISSQSINVLPSTDIYAKDQAGTVSYLSPFSLAQPFHAGSLLAGESIHGQLSYLISKNLPVQLYVDGIWSGGNFGFTIQQGDRK